MIKGMTGFGNASLTLGKIKGIIEIKSQNHRYFDINYYLPIGFSSIENKIRQYVQKNIKRGRVTVSVKILEKPSSKLFFNKEIVKEYLKYVHILKKEYNLDDNISLADLIKLPGIFESKETLVHVDDLWPVIEKGLSRSLTSLMNMRKREGKTLATDTSTNLKKMLMHIKNIQNRAKSILKDKRKDLSPDEFLSLQKGYDINEEITRLKHYVDEFKLLLKSNVSVGKKLDFIAQEMQRETNTIGAKLPDKIVSHAVIALKSKIEKLREQAQNIE